MPPAHAPIESIEAGAYRVPTDTPEADGTFTWERTPLVVAEVTAGGTTGLGYTYSSVAAVPLIRSLLGPVLVQEDAFAIPALWQATRCCGYTGFLRAAALADAQPLPLSAHTAPALHLPVCCAAPRLRHLEWFHDHVRIEQMLFDGAPKPRDGVIRPDLSQPGHGLEFKRADAERFAV